MLLRLLSWICVVIIPAIPVALFYILFTNQNYFEMTGFFKGVTATGPIGAYILIFWMGQRIFQKINKVYPFLIESKSIKYLKGKWEYESISINKSVRTGVCYIREHNGAVKLKGTIVVEGEKVGSWSSKMAGVVDDKLMVFYDWQEVKDNKSVKMEGICTIMFGEPPFNEMNGNWTGIGFSDAFGTIKYTKKES